MVATSADEQAPPTTAKDEEHAVKADDDEEVHHEGDEVGHMVNRPPLRSQLSRHSSRGDMPPVGEMLRRTASLTQPSAQGGG